MQNMYFSKHISDISDIFQSCSIYATTMKMMQPSHRPQARRKCWWLDSGLKKLWKMKTGLIDRWWQPFARKLHVLIETAWFGMSVQCRILLTNYLIFLQGIFPALDWMRAYYRMRRRPVRPGGSFPETRFPQIPILHYELSHLNSQTFLVLLHLSNRLITWPNSGGHFLLEFETGLAMYWRVRYVFVAYNQCWNGQCYCNFSLLLHFSPQQISGGENIGNDYWFGSLCL